MEVVEVFVICRESIQLGKGSIVGGEGRSSLARAQPPGCAVNHFLVFLVNRKQMRLVCIAIAADSGRILVAVLIEVPRAAGSARHYRSVGCTGISAHLGARHPSSGLHEARNEREYARM
jgi:hypothetical protein